LIKTLHLRYRTPIGSTGPVRNNIGNSFGRAPKGEEETIRKHIRKQEEDEQEQPDLEFYD